MEYCLHTKKCGGLGFKQMEQVNEALLAKTAWRLSQNPQALWANVCNMKYKTSSSGSNKLSHGSHTWRSIQKGKELISQGGIGIC